MVRRRRPDRAHHVLSRRLPRRLVHCVSVPGSDGYWGLTTTGADDQLVLLSNPAAADPGTAVGVKHGWLGVDDDGLWAVNSDALITVDGDLIANSVLTQHNSDEQSGVTLVESLAKIAADAVG
jgi:hypothetical protein